jgi:hypothetical protein
MLASRVTIDRDYLEIGFPLKELSSTRRKGRKWGA